MASNSIGLVMGLEGIQLEDGDKEVWRKIYTRAISLVLSSSKYGLLLTKADLVGALAVNQQQR